MPDRSISIIYSFPLIVSFIHLHQLPRVKKDGFTSSDYLVCQLKRNVILEWFFKPRCSTTNPYCIDDITRFVTLAFWCQNVPSWFTILGTATSPNMTCVGKVTLEPLTHVWQEWMYIDDKICLKLRRLSCKYSCYVFCGTVRCTCSTEEWFSCIAYKFNTLVQFQRHFSYGSILQIECDIIGAERKMVSHSSYGKYAYFQIPLLFSVFLKEALQNMANS